MDEKGDNLGVMTPKEALAIAATKELDLILTVPGATPPIAKIANYDKFRYEKNKELRKQKQAQKTLEMKQIQISMREAKNDLMTKVGRLQKFLDAGHKVEILLTLRGREKGMQDFAKGKLREFLTLITSPHTITQDIRPAGRGIGVQIIKK